MTYNDSANNTIIMFTLYTCTVSCATVVIFESEYFINNWGLSKIG